MKFVKSWTDEVCLGISREKGENIRMDGLGKEKGEWVLGNRLGETKERGYKLMVGLEYKVSLGGGR